MFRNRHGASPRQFSHRGRMVCAPTDCTAAFVRAHTVRPQNGTGNDQSRRSPYLTVCSAIGTAHLRGSSLTVGAWYAPRRIVLLLSSGRTLCAHRTGPVENKAAAARISPYDPQLARRISAAVLSPLAHDMRPDETVGNAGRRRCLPPRSPAGEGNPAKGTLI